MLLTVFSIYVVKVWKHKRVEATNKIILLCNTKFNVFYKNVVPSFGESVNFLAYVQGESEVTVLL
jgi:hypothetical protein